MVRLKWIALFFLGLLISQAQAEESVVIDAQMLGEPPSATDTKVSDQAIDTTISQADANRERILKGGKISARQKREMARAETSDNNKQQGEVFLAQNKIKSGVITLPSGVQYKVLRAGKGKVPTESSVVLCRYRGTLIDGVEFDKSESKKAAALNVATLLPGLKEAVQLMAVGAKWQIVVPPQLAYGEAGNRGVGSNAVLIYTMEIVSVR